MDELHLREKFMQEIDMQRICRRIIDPARRTGFGIKRKKKLAAHRQNFRTLQILAKEERP